MRKRKSIPFNTVEEKNKLPYQNILRVNSNDFWFNNFKPDLEVKGTNQDIILLNRRLSDYTETDTFNITTDSPNNAEIYFTMNKNVSSFIDTFADKKRQHIPDYKDTHGSSIQINFDNGISFIMINAETCYDKQLEYEYRQNQSYMDCFSLVKNRWRYEAYIKNKMDDYIKSQSINTPVELNKGKSKTSKHNYDLVSEIRNNPNNYFWFYDFKPDISIIAYDKLLMLMQNLRITVDSGILNGISYLSDEINIPQKNLFYVDTEYISNYTEYLKNEYGIEIDDNICSFEILCPNDERYIFVACDNYYPLPQILCDFKHYQANKAKYQCYKNFLDNYSDYVKDELFRYMGFDELVADDVEKLDDFFDEDDDEY
jgi:hypothetical protein